MKLIIICFILFEIHICSAQSYVHFPDSNARWSELSYLYGAGPGGYSSSIYNGYLYSLGNDTIIDGYEYTLVGYQSTFHYQIDNPGWIIHSNNYPLNPPGQIFGAIREDTNKKVWFRKLFDHEQGYCDATQLFPFNTDKLLYDFDLHVGDV